MQSGVVFNIQRYCVQDGPGIRTTVFLKGCPLCCSWCHNPEGISPEPEITVVETRCMLCGECRKACRFGESLPGEGMLPTQNEPCTMCEECVKACPTGARQVTGREMAVEDVAREVTRDRIFYEDSGGGVTFSGGEPLMRRALQQYLHPDGGIGSITDSLSALKETVFESRAMTLLRLIQVLGRDFENEEVLRQRLVNRTHKYGNDDDYADDIMRMVFAACFEEIDGRPDARGGRYRVEMLPTTSHVYFGSVTGAMPDGRKAGPAAFRRHQPCAGGRPPRSHRGHQERRQDGPREDRRHAAQHEVLPRPGGHR